MVYASLDAAEGGFADAALHPAGVDAGRAGQVCCLWSPDSQLAQ